jgi:tetratricopeptide (TPR) repeat protein
MINKIDWLTSDQWTKSATLDEDDNQVNINSPDAVKFDLYAALRVSYYREEEFEEALEKIKKAYKILFPEKWRSLEGTMYYKKDGKLKYVMPLYALNDLLDNFGQVKRLMFYL